MPRAAGNVEHLARPIAGRGGPQVGVHHIGDIGEVPCLFPIAVDRGRPAGQQGGDELRHRHRVLVFQRLPRPEDVEVAQADRLEAVQAGEHGAVDLHRQLRGGVGGLGLRKDPFTLRKGRVVPIDGAGGGVNHPAHAMLFGEPEQVERGGHIDVVVGGRVVHRFRDRTQRRLVENHPHPFHGPAQHLFVPDVAANEFDFAGDAFQVLEGAGRQVVHDPDPVAPLDQGLSQMGADEPGSPGDQYFQDFSPWESAILLDRRWKRWVEVP